MECLGWSAAVRGWGVVVKAREARLKVKGVVRRWWARAARRRAIVVVGMVEGMVGSCGCGCVLAGCVLMGFGLWFDWVSKR